jgi:hypothetical protein
MEHDEAIRLQAAERYVARELSPAEKESFEAHFFDCTLCADDVRSELMFRANARAVLREQRAAPAIVNSLKRWRPALAFSFAANLVLAAGLGFVLLTGTHESARPRFTQPYYFAPGQARSAGDVHVIPLGETTYKVRFPAPGAASQSYSYEIGDADGQRESSGTLIAPASADGSLYLEVPLGRLGGGVHTLTVRGGADGAIVSWSRFETAR